MLWHLFSNGKTTPTTATKQSLDLAGVWPNIHPVKAKPVGTHACLSAAKNMHVNVKQATRAIYP